MGDIRRNRLNLDAIPPPRHQAAFLELLHDALDDVAGHSKADANAAARGRKDRGVDAHHLAVDIEGRTPGIAVIDRSIDLQEVVIRTRADVASPRRGDARRDGPAETAGTADRAHPIPDA